MQVPQISYMYAVCGDPGEQTTPNEISEMRTGQEDVAQWEEDADIPFFFKLTPVALADEQREDDHHAS